MDERTRRWERLAATEGGSGRLRVATERLRAGEWESALSALQGVDDPQALVLKADVLFSQGRLIEAAEVAGAAARVDPSLVSEDLAVPLARGLRAHARERVGGRDPLFDLSALRLAVDLGDAALDAVADAAGDLDPLVRGMAARVPALRAGLVGDASPYVRFMARSPDPEARANAWRPLAAVEVPLASGTARIPLAPLPGCHHLRVDVARGEAALTWARVHDDRGRLHDKAEVITDALGLGHTVIKAPGGGARAQELELAFAPGEGVARLEVWGNDTGPMAQRLFGAHGPDFMFGLFVGFEARYPARLAFFEHDFFQAVDRLLTGSTEHLIAYAGDVHGYGLGFAEGQVHGAILEQVEQANRGRVLPFRLQVSGPRPLDHLEGLSPSDTLSADDERLARRFAGDLHGHGPARLREPEPGAALHRRILSLFRPRESPTTEVLDPLLDEARVEYGPVGYRALEAFIHKAMAEVERGSALGAPVSRPLRRPKRDDDRR